VAWSPVGRAAPPCAGKGASSGHCVCQADLAVRARLQVDIYAFGIMLNEMITRELPWGGMALPDIRSSVLQGGRPEQSLSCPRNIQVRNQGIKAG